MSRVGQWANLTAHVTAVFNGGEPCAGGCGWPLDPAATKNWDGQQVYDRHPGCEAGGAQLQLIQGGKTA